MLMLWFTSTCSPPSPPACTLPCKHWGHLIFRPTKINNNSNNNRTKTTQITKTRRLNLGSWMSMSIHISFSSISFIRVSQDTVGTIFGTGLHICIIMRWISSMFDFGFIHTKYIQHPVYINTICLTFVFKPCGNSAWARQCTPLVAFRPPWKITSCRYLFWSCLFVNIVSPGLAVWLQPGQRLRHNVASLLESRRLNDGTSLSRNGSTFLPGNHR